MPKGFFDFQEVAKNSNDLDEFIKGAQKNVKKNTASSENSKKPSNKQTLPYIIIALLLVCLVILGYYTLNVQNIMNQGPSETEQTGQTMETAATQKSIERKVDKVISGNGFSILVDRDTPENFEITESEVDFNFLDDKMGSVTKILAKNADDNSGLEVYVSEYDNKLDIASFTRTVQESLGSGYEIDETSLEISKGFRLNRIDNLADKNNSFYVTATSENYYVIKYDNSAKENDKLQEYSRFIDLMIENLYLN